MVRRDRIGMEASQAHVDVDPKEEDEGSKEKGDRKDNEEDKPPGPRFSHGGHANHRCTVKGDGAIEQMPSRRATAGGSSPAGAATTAIYN